jgi:2-C-methyl-D-erythritol 4-phosphate cytidylyltransferase
MLIQSIPQVSEIVLVTRQTDLKACEALKSHYSKLTKIVQGGNTRHRSEFAGIQALAGEIDGGRIDAVLVHDAVRPFASKQLASRLLAEIDSLIGCIPGLPVRGNTVLVDNGWIADYPTNLWAVQTPQAFQATWLLEAHNKAARQGFIGTDTASVVEWAGGDVKVIEGEADNIKITTPADLVDAERIAAKRPSG